MELGGTGSLSSLWRIEPLQFRNNQTGLNMGTRQIAKVGHGLKNQRGEKLNKNPPDSQRRKAEDVCNLSLELRASLRDTGDIFRRGSNMDKICCSINQTGTGGLYYKPSEKVSCRIRKGQAQAPAISSICETM
jgi:hypothetical protein